MSPSHLNCLHQQLPILAKKLWPQPFALEVFEATLPTPSLEAFHPCIHDALLTNECNENSGSLLHFRAFFITIATVLLLQRVEDTSPIATSLTHGQERLQQEPKDVAEFVDWTNFLRETNGRQKEFTERGAMIHAMYNLMADYSVAVPDADAASVKMMESMLSNLSALVQQVDSTLEERTTAFCDDIETSIVSLRTQATELDAEANDPILFDGETEMVDALSLLAKVDESFQQLKADSLRFADYQEILKVPVEQWSSAPFESLNTDLMQQQVTRYAKVVAQSDKGLPSNTVVPILKEKVSTFKGMVPVVVALRNEALKEHHWKQIADAIDRTIERDEGFTLGHLLELRVNEYKEQIETISTSATQ
ncbi:MAG: hypothetical protein SGPRY_009465, partial [Prymnesium sp.]